MNSLMLCSMLTFVGSLVAMGSDRDQYDFRQSKQYAALSGEDRDKIETVNRDFALLWGALDMYADDHENKAPDTLEELVPHYLRELPRDPFATEETAAEHDTHPNKPSCDGWGYRYRPTQTQAWVIASVGLKDFPYLARRDNKGLYKAKGFWTGGILFTR